MTEEKKSAEIPKAESEKKTAKKKKELVPNTMNIQLVNSFGDEITATGTCSDKEIKAVCRALYHRGDQKFEVKKHDG